MHGLGMAAGCRRQAGYGDSFAYALAKQCGKPALFKARDFDHTDIVAIAKK
jgi:uncharacterized protein with PIN domain